MLAHLSRWLGFRMRGPWITRFEIDGRQYGGWYDGPADPRLDWFFGRFPRISTILELGALEGGHSTGMARRPHVERVVAIEGRQSNIVRARFAQQQTRSKKIEFILADLEQVDLSIWGKFDAVFCCGLLYHLPRPWELIERIGKASDRLFLSTHFVPDDQAKIRRNGIPGLMVGEHGLRDPLSGLSAQSFWPTLSGLERMLGASGYRVDPIFAEDRSHPNGPLVTLAAVKK